MLGGCVGIVHMIENETDVFVRGCQYMIGNFKTTE